MRLTPDNAADSARPMGRPPLNMPSTNVRLPDELRERIKALVGPKGMAAFIREAIERELERRDREKDARDGA